MAIKRDILKMNIIDSDPRQVLIAKYLRKTDTITSQLMESADAFYYSYALAANPDVSDAALELAISESVLALSNQIRRILNFHRIDNGIALPNEFLAQCGLAFASSAPAVPQERLSKARAAPTEIALPSATQQISEITIEPLPLVPSLDDDEDDDGEYDYEILPLSPDVISLSPELLARLKK
jgi:hypothetical protein